MWVRKLFLKKTQPKKTVSFKSIATPHLENAKFWKKFIHLEIRQCIDHQSCNRDRTFPNPNKEDQVHTNIFSHLYAILQSHFHVAVVTAETVYYLITVRYSD